MYINVQNLGLDISLTLIGKNYVEKLCFTQKNNILEDAIII
jgi:hypothetical protein